MSSLKRVIASRANGARSRGPITPAGKRNSSQNAIRHGLLAKCLLLENESRKGFDSLLAQFVARFAPADGVELGLIEDMFSAFWRQRRAWAIKTRIMDTALSREPPDHDQLTRLSDAFTAVSVHPQLELMHRYETRLHRIFQRALSNLVRMRAFTVPPPAGEAVGEKSTLPNEPTKLLKTMDHPNEE